MRRRPKASHAWQLEEISKPSSYKVVGERKVCKECRLSPLRRSQDDAKSGCLRAQNNISRHRSQHLFSHLTCHSSTSRPQALCCNSHRLDLPEEINLKLHTLWVRLDCPYCCLQAMQPDSHRTRLLHRRSWAPPALARLPKILLTGR